MNLGSLANFIIENKLDDCYIKEVAYDEYDIISFENDDMIVHSYINTGRLYNSLFAKVNENRKMCGDITVEAIFKMRSGIIPDDISTMLSVIKKEPIDVEKMESYLNESLANESIELENLMDYRYYPKKQEFDPKQMIDAVDDLHRMVEDIKGC